MVPTRGIHRLFSQGMEKTSRQSSAQPIRESTFNGSTPGGASRARGSQSSPPIWTQAAAARAMGAPERPNRGISSQAARPQVAAAAQKSGNWASKARALVTA